MFCQLKSVLVFCAPQRRSTFPCHHIHDAGLHENRVALGRRQSHGLGRLEQVQHVGLRTEVQLGSLLLHVDVNAVDTAPYTLRGERQRDTEDFTLDNFGNDKKNPQGNQFSLEGKLGETSVSSPPARLLQTSISFCFSNVARGDYRHFFF